MKIQKIKVLSKKCDIVILCEQNKKMHNSSRNHLKKFCKNIIIKNKINKEVKSMSYADKFSKSDLTYTDIAHELGVCELSARNKINGKARITRAEEKVLDQLFGEEDTCLTETRTN